MHSAVRGFSLVELMVVLTIVSILLAVAAPGFLELIRNNRIVSETFALRAALNNARSEALARRSFVVICPTTDGTGCSGDNDDWVEGYMTFVDTNNDNAPDNSNPDEEITQLHREPSTLDISFSGANPRIRFDAQGSTLGFQGLFTFCDERGVESARGLILNPVGSLGSAVDTDSPEDGIINNTLNPDDPNDTNVGC